MDAATVMDRRPLLEQLATIRSLMREHTERDDGSRDEIVKDVAKESMRSKKEQLVGLSSEALLIVLLDALLLHFIEGEEGRRVTVPTAEHGISAAKKKKRAAAKKKRYKRNKAIAKQHKKTKMLSWLGGGIISLITMVAFNSITLPIVTISLLHQSDGSSEVNAPPALPPTTSRTLRSRDYRSNNNAAPILHDSDIVSPLPAVVPPPIFSPAAAVTVDNTNLKSFESPTTSCTDIEGWYNEAGFDCSWYEAVDLPGCPQYGTQTAHGKSLVKGTASDNCCYCMDAVVSTPSPTKAPSSSSTSTTCVDTPNWVDKNGNGCDHYEMYHDPGCPHGGTDQWAGIMGSAAENCCFCQNPSCDDFRSACERDTNKLQQDGLSPFCQEAESSCCENEDHYLKIANRVDNYTETFGLYDECKCEFWFGLCEDTQADACNYAAQYCCGDYRYEDNKRVDGQFSYLNSDTCYCDFYNYVHDELGYEIQPKALNFNDKFKFCLGQFQDDIAVYKMALYDFRGKYERTSLEAIYNGTNGKNWKKNTGWMNEEIDHCQWYGIRCGTDGFVISIDLKDNNLAGQFPVYSRDKVDVKIDKFDGNFLLSSQWMWAKYGLANLYSLETLNLADNKLIGTIDYRPLYNLVSLTSFDVSGNQLSGEVDALVTPSLTYADFSNNRFTSIRRFKKYKLSPFKALRYIDVSNNSIQNNATEVFANIPPNIERFLASNNRIKGSLPESLSEDLTWLSHFNMSYNYLSGSVPSFHSSFETLAELDLSKQMNGSYFTGSIPDNIWGIDSLQILNLADNRITGSIPSSVTGLRVIEELDFSNNRLGSSIPPELGLLQGSLLHVRLTNNRFTGRIPSEIQMLKGASILLEGNHFQDGNKSKAPLSLCTLANGVKEFDLRDDVTFCPIERNALSEFYHLSKGPEWTVATNWVDEYEDNCDWHGITCDDMKHVTKLELANNGLSGRLSESIGKLTYIEVMDLSDNNIKGSIPEEIGLLSNLTYLRLSYNTFTGMAPEGLGELTKLQLLQLQSNRLTEMPKIPKLNDAKYGESTFVTDCGRPSIFDEAIQCGNCTMCCNALDDCYPKGRRPVEKMGLTYSTFGIIFFSIFFVICSCCVVGRLLYRIRNAQLSMSMQPEEDDLYAVSKIGKDSVYSYIVTEKLGVKRGCLIAFTTIAIQAFILVFFIKASEVSNLENNDIDIEFTWKCPPDDHTCDNRAGWTMAGWVSFVVLMIAFLAKDMINGLKLLSHSSKVRHPPFTRIRYFVGGTSLVGITAFAFYVSTIYNFAIATANTEIIANSVIVLFVMEIDENIFFALDAINEKWTAHSTELEKESEMKDEIERQRARIASQEEEIRMLREAVEAIQSQVACLGLWQLRSDKKDAVTTMMTASDIDSAKCVVNTGEAEAEEVKEMYGVATSPKTISTCNTFESMATNGSDDSHTHAGKEGA